MTSPSTEFSPPKGGQPCPCGTGKTFAVCCQPVLLQQRKAASPEELMRSRFTAHVAHDWAHLHRTFEETAKEPYDATEDPQAADWTRLEIHSHGLGPKPGMGYVDFTAHYKEGDVMKTLPEKAEFRNVEGTWLYTGPIRQGPAPVKAAAAKVGRNDPCPCGSGKKYKQCCLK